MRSFFVGCFLLPILLVANPFPHFNPNTVQTFKGKISSIQQVGYATRPTPHTQLLLRTQKGEISVDLGPEWYIHSEGIVVIPGQQVTIEGSLLVLDGAHFVIASSITIGNQTYLLREKDGRPLWRKGP